MAKVNAGRARVRRPLSLPDLTAFAGEVLQAGRDYDAIDFADRDFTGQDAGDARFLECRFHHCNFDRLSMRRSRLVESSIAEAHGASFDCTNSSWRDSEMTGGRLGAMTLPGATLASVRFRGVKFGFLDLAGSHLDDIVLESCEIDSLDARSAQMRSVGFVDCIVHELNVSEATLSKVDLSGARLQRLVGVGSLRGAIVSHDQLLDLAPLLAAQLGLEVRPD